MTSELPYARYPVRIGAQIQPQHCSYPEIRRVAAALEDLGVDAILNWDHFFPVYVGSDAEHYECWTVLAAWAEATSRVQIGPLVTCNSYRNPDLLADMARTVDHISDGRLIFGIGAGWREKDYREYRYEFGTPGRRLDALAAALPRIKKRWSRLNPPPRPDMPLLIGGNGPRKTLRLAAMHADIWHGFGDAEQLAERHRILDRWCAELGRDPGEIERSTRVFCRTPEMVGQDLIDVGTRFLTLVVQVPKFDAGEIRDWLEFRDDVNRRMGLREPAVSLSASS